MASLISVPLQNNVDFDGGAREDGFRYLVNVQPVIPLSLTKDWNLIVRTILPVIHQSDVVGPSSQSGLGDTVASLFLSPGQPGRHGVIWGVGPVALLPTATDDLLGSERWGGGPTAVALRQVGGFTAGILANHIASFAGNDRRRRVNATFLHPFLSYTTTATSVALNAESTYDGEGSQWTIPLNVAATQVVTLGGQLLSVGPGARYYAAGPDGTPEWGLRFIVTFLFPRG